jgi:hypothetical protein
VFKSPTPKNRTKNNKKTRAGDVAHGQTLVYHAHGSGLDLPTSQNQKHFQREVTSNRMLEQETLGVNHYTNISSVLETVVRIH